MKGYYKNCGTGREDFEKDITENVSKSFNKLMELNEVSKSEVAQETGLTPKYLRRLSKNERVGVGIYTLYHLAEYFSVSIDELIGRD